MKTIPAAAIPTFDREAVVSNIRRYIAPEYSGTRIVAMKPATAKKPAVFFAVPMSADGVMALEEYTAIGREAQSLGFDFAANKAAKLAPDARKIHVFATSFELDSQVIEKHQVD